MSPILLGLMVMCWRVRQRPLSRAKTIKAAWPFVERNYCRGMEGNELLGYCVPRK
jgi:hypothetical protein